MRPIKTYLISLISAIAIACVAILYTTHLGSVIQITSLLVYFSIVVCGAWALLGMSDGNRAFGYIVARTPSGTKMRDVQTIESLGMMAGIVIAMMGLIHVLYHFDKPELIGPGAAVAFVGLFYPPLFNIIFFIPAKLSLTFDQKTHTVSSTWMKDAVYCILALSGIAGSAYLEGAHFSLYYSLPGFLLVLILPIVLVVVSQVGGNASNAWFQCADLAINGAIVAAVSQLIHVMENLDKPELIMPDISQSAIPILYSVLVFGYCNLKGLSREKNERKYGHLVYNISAVLILAGVTLTILLALIDKSSH